MTTIDRVSFVHALDIGVVHPKLAKVSLAKEVAPTGPAAAVDAGSLMSFTANVSAQHRSDALNSTLLAQLNSDKLFNRFDPAQLIAWYRNYTTVLSNIGWDMQEFQFEKYQAAGSTMSVSTAVLGVLGAVLPAGELALVAAALKALAALKSDDPWYRVWDVTTHDQSNGNFQVSNCADQDGAANTLVMRMSGYSLRTSETTVRFLWNDYQASSTDLLYASQTTTLDEDVYGQVRQAVIKKLGAKAVQYVGNLDI